MPLSYQTHSVSSSASGSGLQFSVTYSFLLKAHVKLYYGLDILAGTSTSLLVDGVDYNWTSSTQVTLTSAPSSNQTLTIIRDTPDSSQQVVWQDGSNLIADDMNTADRQNLFVVQEQQDRNDLAATKAINSETASNAATTAVNQAVLADGTRAMTGNLNANSNKVVNLANPTAGGDAVNKTFADATYQPLDAELTELATMAGDTAAALADLTQAEVNILDGATVSTSELNTLDGVTASTAELNKLDGVTSSTAELNILDGVTATASELNALDGITASTAELNKLDGVTASTAELNTVDGVTSAIQTQLDGKQPLDAELTELATMQSTTASALADLTQAEVQILDGATLSTAELNTLDGITATAAELNVLDGATATTADLNKLNAVSATSAELNKLDGVTSTTNELNILDGVTATTTELNVTDGLTASTSELNQLDGKTISSTLTPTGTNDIPTSSAVNTFVSGLLNALGGFVAIPNETSFPATNPDPSDNAGTVVSIADAGGMSVNSSGVSVTGRTTNGSVVTINGFPSSLQSTTLGAGLGLQVQTTTTLNTYTYHKLIAKEADVKQLSDDINDFQSRYRVSANAPTTDLDAGDLWFDTTAGKMKVYDANDSAWEEVQSVGNFFINTLSSSSGTGGGSATFNGSAYRFTLSNAGANAQQMLVSVNGVIQKPNSGTSQPSEGFAIDTNDIVFAAAPASGASHFIVTIGSTVNVGQPSNNTVDTSELVDGAVTNAKVSSSAAIAGTKISPDFGAQNIETDGTIQASKLGVNKTQSTYTLEVSGGPADTAASFESTDATARIVFKDNSGEAMVGATGNDLTFYTSTSANERMRISSAGNVAIGNQAPASLLDIRPGVAGSINAITMGYGRSANPTDAIHKIRWASDDLVIEADTANTIASNIQFRNDGTEYMRLDSSGRLGLGVNSPQQKQHIHENSTAASVTQYTNSVTGSTAGDGLLVGLDSTEDGLFWMKESNNLTFGTANSERLRIDSSGRLLIAHTSNYADGGADDLVVGNTGTSEQGITIGASTLSQIRFADAGRNTAGYVLYNHGTDSLNFGANGTERMRILSDGTLRLGANCPGIDFSQIQTNASGMTSETLDSYEEGTWTPQILGVSANGTWTAASNNGGFYVKIGKQVTAWFNAVGSLSGATGHTMRLHGLPFTSSSNHSPSGSGNAVYSAGSMQYWSGAGAQVIGPLVEPNTTIAYFHTYGSGSTSGAQVAIVNGNHNLHAFVTYFVA